MSYELTDFEKDVIETARSTPVVLDFWAAWCGPCRQLGPIIEKLAGEADGRWKLVKVDTEKNPDLAIQFGIRGIPAVKMVYQDEVIAEFTGAQPEHLIRKWLDENLPSEADSSDELLVQVKELLGQGKREQARQALQGSVNEDSADELKVKYAMLLLPDDIPESEQVMGWVSQVPSYDLEIQTIETVKHLKALLSQDELLQDSGKAGEIYLEGAREMFNADFEQAIPNFIEALQLDRKMDDDGPRKACIACFTMLGEQHPLTIQYRRPFSMSLY